MKLKLVEDDAVVDAIKSYPKAAAKQLLYIRGLLIKLGTESNEIEALEEMFKWGEPSYRTNIGSTVRLAWKKSTPNKFYLYFVCTTKLVDTFKELYADRFEFEKNRAMVFQLDEDLNEESLCHCLLMAMTYHKLKHLPLLGA